MIGLLGGVAPAAGPIDEPSGLRGVLIFDDGARVAGANSASDALPAGVVSDRA
jgi:hypothetical protein